MEKLKGYKKFDTVLNTEGQEVNDPKPRVCNTGLNRPPTLQEQIARIIKSNISREAEELGYETEEEAEDFDVGSSFEQGEMDTIYQVVDEEIPVQQVREEVSEVGDETKETPPDLEIQPNMETSDITDESEKKA